MRPFLLVMMMTFALAACGQSSDRPAELSANTGEQASKKPQTDRENTLFLDLVYGRVVIKLRPDLAPNHVKRFKMLTREGFYDGLKFHRVIRGFMVQGGDPNGDGSGSSKYPDVKAEFTNTPFRRGTVGAARSNSPDSANSQFYIMLGRSPHLDGQYTVFGEVTDGMAFVSRIRLGDPANNGAVSDPDIIVKMRVAADVKE